MAGVSSGLFETLPFPPMAALQKAFQLFPGHPADGFQLDVEKTPMSTLKEASIFVAVYYTSTFGGQALM